MNFVTKNGMVALVYDSREPEDRYRLMALLGIHSQVRGREGRKALSIKTNLEAEAALKEIKDEIR